MFYHKQDDRCIMVRNNVVFVAKKFSQVEGLDFGEIFAQTRPEAICILLGYASNHDTKLF